MVARKSLDDEPAVRPVTKKATVPEKKKSNEAARSHRAYEGKPVTAGSIKGTLSYLTRANCSIEQRDYFVGSVRVAYMRVLSPKSIELFLYAKQEERALKPLMFGKPEDAHKFILGELAL